MLKVLHISDTHTYHNALKIPEGIDMIIHSGDCSNQRDPYNNEYEVRDFLMWYENLDVRYKIFCAGNHDTSLEKGLITSGDIQSKGIMYLFNDSIEVEGLKIWGSPYTPTFGQGWAFNQARHKFHDLYETIPEDTDIVITHGPPQSILDIALHSTGMEYCGCKSLLKAMQRLQPSLHCFGHIHENVNNLNAGTRTISGCKTIFSNGSAVIDGKFQSRQIANHGNIFNL